MYDIFLMQKIKACESFQLMRYAITKSKSSRLNLSVFTFLAANKPEHKVAQDIRPYCCSLISVSHLSSILRTRRIFALTFHNFSSKTFKCLPEVYMLPGQLLFQRFQILIDFPADKFQPQFGLSTAFKPCLTWIYKINQEILPPMVCLRVCRPILCL